MSVIHIKSFRISADRLLKPLCPTVNSHKNSKKFKECLCSFTLGKVTLKL